MFKQLFSFKKPRVSALAPPSRLFTSLRSFNSFSHTVQKLKLAGLKERQDTLLNSHTSLCPVGELKKRQLVASSEYSARMFCCIRVGDHALSRMNETTTDRYETLACQILSTTRTNSKPSVLTRIELLGSGPFVKFLLDPSRREDHVRLTDAELALCCERGAFEINSLLLRSIIAEHAYANKLKLEYVDRAGYPGPVADKTEKKKAKEKATEVKEKTAKEKAEKKANAFLASLTEERFLEIKSLISDSSRGAMRDAVVSYQTELVLGRDSGDWRPDSLLSTTLNPGVNTYDLRCLLDATICIPPGMGTDKNRIPEEKATLESSVAYKALHWSPGQCQASCPESEVSESLSFFNGLFDSLAAGGDRYGLVGLLEQRREEYSSIPSDDTLARAAYLDSFVSSVFKFYFVSTVHSEARSKAAVRWKDFLKRREYEDHYLASGDKSLRSDCTQWWRAQVVKSPAETESARKALARLYTSAYHTVNDGGRSVPAPIFVTPKAVKSLITGHLSESRSNTVTRHLDDQLRQGLFKEPHYGPIISLSRGLVLEGKERAEADPASREISDHLEELLLKPASHLTEGSTDGLRLAAAYIDLTYSNQSDKSWFTDSPCGAPATASTGEEPREEELGDNILWGAAEELEDNILLTLARERTRISEAKFLSLAHTRIPEAKFLALSPEGTPLPFVKQGQITVPYSNEEPEILVSLDNTMPLSGERTCPNDGKSNSNPLKAEAEGCGFEQPGGLLDGTGKTRTKTELLDENDPAGETNKGGAPTVENVQKRAPGTTSKQNTTRNQVNKPTSSSATPAGDAVRGAKQSVPSRHTTGQTRPRSGLTALLVVTVVAGLTLTIYKASGLTGTPRGGHARSGTPIVSWWLFAIGTALVLMAWTFSPHLGAVLAVALVLNTLHGGPHRA